MNFTKVHSLQINSLDFRKETQSWRIRQKKRSHITVTRLKAEHPRNAEGFAIRLLARSSKGITSFEELRTTVDVTGEKTVHETFADAAKACYSPFQLM